MTTESVPEMKTTETGHAAAGRPFYSKVTLGGLAGFVVAIALLGTAIAMESVSDGIFAVVILGVVGLIAGAVYRFGGRAHMVSALAAVLGLLLLAPVIAGAVVSPDSFFEFVAVIVGLPSLLAVLGGSITVLVQRRRPGVRSHGKPLELAAIRVAIAVLGMVALTSAGLTVAGIDRVDAADKQGAVRIDMRASAFAPGTLTLQAGQPSKLLLVNADPFVHTFTVDAAGVDVRFGPKDEKLVMLEGLATGTYEFKCDVPGHSAMKGVLVVE